MSLVAYTITALERDTADADASGKQVIVGATCSMFIQPANTVVQLFDNSSGANGSTAKTTGSNGQVTVYVDPGVYRVSVNGSDSFVTIANDADAIFDSVVIGGVNVINDLAPKENPSFTGNVGIGTTSPSQKLEVSGNISINNSSTFSLLQMTSANTSFNTINFGDIDDSNIGQVLYDHTTDSMRLITNNLERMRIDSAGDILPGANGTQDLGSTALRWNTLFATNATINTSDANEKQDIESLNAAETRVAQSCKLLLRKFRWIDMVEEKGDDARIHFGIIAQDLQQAFADEGLDAGRYAMFTSDTWTDESTGEETTRMGVRYTELLAFIIAGL